MSTTACRPASRRSSLVASCCVLLLWAGSFAMGQEALSGESRGLRLEGRTASSADIRQRLSIGDSRSRVTVDRQRLLRRVTVPMENLSAVGRADEPGRELGDHVFFDEMSKAVLNGVKRATRRAVKSYLLEATAIDRRLQLFKSQRQGRQDPGGEERSRVKFDVGISRLRPEVEMRYELDRAALKLSVGAQGRLGLKYRSERMGTTEIRAGYHPGDGYRLHCRFGF